MERHSEGEVLWPLVQKRCTEIPFADFGPAYLDD
jgi:hypothetical protein